MGKTSMNEEVRRLAGWCDDQRRSMQKSLDMMRAGTAGTRQKIGDGIMEDTTNATIADLECKISELNELLAKIDADHA